MSTVRGFDERVPWSVVARPRSNDFEILCRTVFTNEKNRIYRDSPNERPTACRVVSGCRRESRPTKCAQVRDASDIPPLDSPLSFSLSSSLPLSMTARACYTIAYSSSCCSPLQFKRRHLSRCVSATPPLKSMLVLVHIVVAVIWLLFVHNRCKIAHALALYRPSHRGTCCCNEAKRVGNTPDAPLRRDATLRLPSVAHRVLPPFPFPEIFTIHRGTVTLGKRRLRNVVDVPSRRSLALCRRLT